MPKSRQEILAEIEEQRAVLDSNAPADEKEFAQAEIFELEQQLQGMETPAEITETSTQEVSEPEKTGYLESSIEPEVEIVKEEVQAVVISEPKISKATQSKIDLLRAAIADQQAVVDSNAPEDEKDFARQEIEEFEATIAVLEGEEPSVQVKPAEPKPEPKKRGPKPGSKRAKVVIETGLEQKKQGKKEPKRKVVLDKPMAEIKKPKKKKVALDADYKNRKNVLPTFDALLVNSKIAKEVSRSFLRKGIKYGIAGHKGIYSIYMIPVSAQLSKAFSVYKEVAEKYDINVNKSTAYTTI